MTNTRKKASRSTATRTNIDRRELQIVSGENQTLNDPKIIFLRAVLPDAGNGKEGPINVQELHRITFRYFAGCRIIKNSIDVSDVALAFSTIEVAFHSGGIDAGNRRLSEILRSVASYALQGCNAATSKNPRETMANSQEILNYVHKRTDFNNDLENGRIIYTDLPLK